MIAWILVALIAAFFLGKWLANITKPSNETESQDQVDPYIDSCLKEIDRERL